MSDLLNKLTNEHSLMSNKNEYYLSVYYPVSDQTRNEIRTYIKSFVLQALRNHNKLKNMTRLHNNILEKIFGKLDSTVGSTLENGIGIFIKFNARKQEKGRLDEIDDTNIEIISFPRKPQKDIFIGNIYNLEQLIWIENVYAEALVLSLNEKDCNIYTIEGNQIDRIHTLINPESRDEDESLRLFVKDVIEYISSSLGSIESKIDYLAVLYSSPYSGIIEEMIDEYISSNKHTILLYINKSIDEPNEIITIVRKKIKESHKKIKKNDIEIAKESYNQYSEGWLESTKAMNMNQVSKLFIKPGAKKTGYLNPHTKLLYTYSKRGTIKVRNIAPWAIKSVIESGGDICILRGDKYINSSDIAVQLRYAKKQHNTNNPDKIKKWVQVRNGMPAIVKNTEDLLRIKFSDDEKDLLVVEWNWFFKKLADNNLLFVYDDTPDSRFCTFVTKG